MIDEELRQQVSQTVGATKSVLALFFNPKESAIADLLPQDTAFGLGVVRMSLNPEKSRIHSAAI
jgi:hypothetical protein